ncbi:MAG: cbb3-type cytochrome oxidase assembly protein CcoS [Xanthomonadaceae bacterium]|nr:cbb3-type cytochrome oxidase assembly protein CcoS [Xanthomonadaceae bacterium]
MLGLAVAAFVWAVKRGQFDDLDTPALDILEDDDRPLPPPPPAAAGEPRAPDA